MTVVVNDESKHSTFSRINIVICFIPCGGPTVICFIPCGSRAADPLDGHRNSMQHQTEPQPKCHISIKIQLLDHSLCSIRQNHILSITPASRYCSCTSVHAASDRATA
ncbi:hypothetical protein J6590_013249 [Homalodisca vitripennis]|nr:hypothetical protein J6590_013249 [Homalodisca vitripennis]